MKSFRYFAPILAVLALAAIGPPAVAAAGVDEIKAATIAYHQEVSPVSLDVAAVCACEVAVVNHLMGEEVNALYARSISPPSTVTEHSLTANADADLRRLLNFEAKQATKRQHWRG